jgi:hypothetical protein
VSNLRRSSILSERRSYLILYIQVQEYSSVAGILFATYMATTIPSEQNVVGMPKARKVGWTCRWRGVQDFFKYGHMKLRSEETIPEIVIARYCRIEEECGEQKTTTFLFPTHRARAAYHEPSLSVRALAYLRKSLSRSFVSTAMSDRYGLMCSAFQRSRVREVREPHGRVSWKFRTREVGY